MKLFRKHITPEELGTLIYERIRQHLASSGRLSIAALLERLRHAPENLPEQHVGAIMVGSMFGAVLAIERSTSRWIADRVVAGMQREFSRHLREQGASTEQALDWEAIVGDHFLAYRSALEGYEGYEPPWKLGRLFYWNIVGVEEYVAPCIKEATMHLLGIQDSIQELVNDYGPTLVVNVST